MKIVVDAMGGDYAPENVVAGVMDAIKEFNHVTIVLVGQQDRIEAELKKYSYPKEKIEIVHAPEVVAMDDHAAVAIRQKRKSSITVGIGLLKNPGYDAFFSAGNTGAVVAASTIVLGMLKGVDRPGIGCVIPSLKDFNLMIDMGANTAAKPEHLLSYAKMGKVYVREVIGREDPKVGLLNIGSEEGKGTELEKEAYKLLEENEKSFIGNVEANEIYTGKADCIVCDGYAGNIALKVSEGLMESVGELLKREIKKSPVAILAALLLKNSLKEAKKQIDYAEYGGAPLLGVDGLVIIGHGRSSAKAVKNAIRSAISEVDHNILVRIKEVL